MPNNLTRFHNDTFSVRSFEDDGVIWFVARDIAEALDYSLDGGIGKYFAHVPDIWKGGKRISVRSENGVEQEREMLCLTEQGLYFFLGRSDKKKAVPYQMWIAGDVVPSIRKHGFYATPETVENIIGNPDAFIQILQEYKNEKARRIELEQQAEIDKPKVAFANAVDASDGCILIGNLAKLICQNGVNIGQNRLFQWLRDNGFLCSRKGDMYNAPTQKAIERGLFKVKENIMFHSDGSSFTSFTTKVTGKGQLFFVDCFLRNSFATL